MIAFIFIILAMLSLWQATFGVFKEGSLRLFWLYIVAFVVLSSVAVFSLQHVFLLPFVVNFAVLTQNLIVVALIGFFITVRIFQRRVFKLHRAGKLNFEKDMILRARRRNQFLIFGAAACLGIKTIYPFFGVRGDWLDGFMQVGISVAIIFLFFQVMHSLKSAFDSNLVVIFYAFIILISIEVVFLFFDHQTMAIEATHGVIVLAQTIVFYIFSLKCYILIKYESSK